MVANSGSPGKRGPKPKPVELHKLHGTFREDRHGPAEHPIDDLAGVPIMPEGMPELAQQMWNAIVPDLVRTKVAVELDSTELAAMCRWWAQYQTLMGKLEKLQPFDKKGEDEQWRLERRARTMWREFDAIACRYGFTPADRARLRLDDGKSGGASDPLAALGIGVN
jgi:phage terminase small subunit